MGIIDLKTDLRSLKFGRDTPGGGDSGQPYIKVSPPDGSDAMERIVQESANFNSDFPIRGGLYSVRAVAEDAIRIRKFLTDFPKGSNFTYKQVGLQRSNPLIETGKNGGRLNTRTYNLNSNLLNSILTSGAGIHYPRAGATPYTLLDDKNKYFSVVSKKETDENRLVQLFNSKIKETPSEYDENLGISSNEFEILNYVGGPDSLYGDGETIIFKSTDHNNVPINTNKSTRTQKININKPLSPSVLGASNFLRKYYSETEANYKIGIYTDFDGTNKDDVSYQNNVSTSFKEQYNTIPYKKIIKEPTHIIGTRVSDFRSKVDNPEFLLNRDYTDPQVNITSRVGIGSPGSRNKLDRSNINTIHTPGQDKVNLIPIVYRNFNEHPEDEVGARDLIKFNFETISNDNPDFTYRTHFRAFITGFNDSMGADWKGNKYSGRGDEMFNYQGFNRDISFTFMIAAQSKQEMAPLYQKIQYLASTLYPDYSPETGFMRGNIHRLTIGEYLYRTPGVLRSLQFSIDDNFPWEIKFDQPEKGQDEDMMELPQVLKVSARFTPILDTLARTMTMNDTNIPSLITNNIGKHNFINNLNILK